jgi:DNA processing protein
MEKSFPNITDLLFLLTIPQIGPVRIRKLFQVFESVEEIIKAPIQKLVALEGFDYKLAQQLKTSGYQGEVEQQLSLIKKHKIQIITIWDKNYPDLLKRISDPPVVLFYKGIIEFLGQNSLAVVGTRTPSDYGKMVTSRIVSQLVEHGVTIISGMARGIDSIAHSICLRDGGKTFAVLGCGLDYCYPPENLKLFQKIPERGIVFSEYFLGVGPDATNFPKRNRIISGLAQGTLVVEAGNRSGALLTAYYALNQNREVFAVPGNITSAKSQGTNRLIKQGAKLVETVEDIIEEIKLFQRHTIPPQKKIPGNLKESERKILLCLSKEPKHIDKLVSDLQETPSTILSGLLTLELMGLVQQLVGKMFVRL